MDDVFQHRWEREKSFQRQSLGCSFLHESEINVVALLSSQEHKNKLQKKDEKSLLCATRLATFLQQQLPSYAHDENFFFFGSGGVYFPRRSFEKMYSEHCFPLPVGVSGDSWNKAKCFPSDIFVRFVYF
ncbi:hypothetical protein CEXT_262271 [Caerostris extrusa]|uniref:Uncharacterized protein n=1 Tax=Caerostris extrusa TaxID=172846 RepID=A0AAV4NIQ0_CAEEX|nr:hypothetical protein CEXT_262271 [Caerostris extrusa]